MFDQRSTPAVAIHPKVGALPALTALRFFAAAYVVAFHYTPYFFPEADGNSFIGLGYSGVTFFFLLSGFILTYNYRNAELGQTHARTLFYRARFARVYPVFLLALLIHVPWFLAWVMKQPMPLKALMASGAVLAPLGIHAWVPGAACSLDCPSWSVSVEFFFYALFPILLPLVLRNPGRIALATLAFWIAAVALATSVWQASGGGVSLIAPEAGGIRPVLLAEFVKYFPLLHLPEFIAGMLLYVAWQNARLPGPLQEERARPVVQERRVVGTERGGDGRVALVAGRPDGVVAAVTGAQPSRGEVEVPAPELRVEQPQALLVSERAGGARGRRRLQRRGLLQEVDVGGLGHAGSCSAR